MFVKHQTKYEYLLQLLDDLTLNQSLYQQKIILYITYYYVNYQFIW